jgi:hypothetical protein
VRTSRAFTASGRRVGAISSKSRSGWPGIRRFMED